jgi:acetoin utilization deacetylase AcuC-like enzyme
MPPVLLMTDDAMRAHNPGAGAGAGAGHPERPERLRAIVEELHRASVEGATWAKPQAAKREWIERVHDRAYIDQIDSLRGRSAQLDEDTAVSPGSVEAAYLAVSSAIGAVADMMNGTSHTAFALVRPPGHHAEHDRAMGFCLFNNIAIAAAHAIAELGVERVLIVDWDVHHGNGTQHLFEDRSDVLVFNTHQWPMYPGTGALHEVGRGEGEGFTVNCPLPAGMDDAAYLSVFNRLLAPIADAYRPQLVLVSAGFDAHRDDPLGEMKLSDDGFAAMCGIARDIAHRHADGRLALVLEGGYDLAALSRSVLRCVEVLAGASPPQVNEPDPLAAGIINELCEAHRRHWPL